MNLEREQLRDHEQEVKLFRRRAFMAFFGLLLLVVALISNLYKLQVDDYKSYTTQSNDNSIQILPVPPPRGLIYDRNGNVLAKNITVYNLDVTPEKVENPKATIERLQQYMQLTPEQIQQFYKLVHSWSRRFSEKDFITDLTDKQVAEFSVHEYEFPGLSIEAGLKRYYPYGEVLTHVLGYVGRINDRDEAQLIKEGKADNYEGTKYIGKIGIEKYYENVLHGTKGYERVEVNSHGRIVRVLKYVPPIPGKDIVLNIDIKLQEYIYKLIHEKKHPGSAIVIDPRNDSVLAMVSSPSYNPNPFVDGISSKAYRKLLDNPQHPLLNRATLGIYPPGSTVKPFITVAALDTGVITPTSTIDDRNGQWRIPHSKDKHIYHEADRWGYGIVNVTKAIEESVDSFFYNIAYKMGIDRLSTWMNKFGFGENTDIDIDEESSANMPTKAWKRARHHEPWYVGDTIPVGIGQGYWTATNMQLAKALVTLIDHGNIEEPHILRATIDHGEQFKDLVLKKYKTIHVMQDVPKKDWDVALNGMRLVDMGHLGTARRVFRGAPYTSGGKTGTSQVFSLDNKNYNAKIKDVHLQDHSLFESFAPFKHPKFVVTVIIEHAGYGVESAAPMARKVLDYCMKNLDKSGNGM
ncbi:penicillin-binding protein 2 [Vibrio sp. S4M6]|uniref:penicillin-binding protein 2 n=1 Tax=Vibrio sinus TaxID=2946865 RepID=UPI00202A092C|nr:penicillin-binding protein 2 [Vibrio sinus]MCL9781510.1 penicillin-binding protein 2 [Vibrio sinus]